MERSLRLPRADGTFTTYVPLAPQAFPRPIGGFDTRVAYAAAHVVCDPLVDVCPLEEASLDWEATLAYRRHLWSHGLAVAEAMDTAQRGAGLGWSTTKELIRRSVAEARGFPGAVIACGAGTDHLDPHAALTLRDVEAAYEEQCSFIAHTGATIILMASRALAASATGPDDYLRVYDRLLSQLSAPVILHWLGAMFDPALAGYWGYQDVYAAMDTCLELIRAHAAKVEGIKLSLLDAPVEIAMRRRLPPGVRMYTGDDFNYLDLIRGDGRTHSDALLGIFDAIAPAAAAALQALDAGDDRQYEAFLAPTLPLARHIFQPPTRFYKTGIVFLAYLNGHQSHFRMVGGYESARSIVHLAELFILADQARLLIDSDCAAERMRRVLAISGVL